MDYMQDEQKLEEKRESEPKGKQAITEEKILDFWQKNDIFKKTLEKSQKNKSSKGNFVFYDGPPFATGEPHYGHVVPGTIKDIIPRYKTMRGYHVARRWGWDCHGLPVENLIEKELNLQSKKDILDYGIGRFNKKARESVMRYTDDWRKVIPRLGRWVDMNNDYRTMDSSYTESVWWAFSKLHKKGLIYEGFKSMHLCPRCETTLSNFEVSQGYKDITDISVYVKFEIIDEVRDKITKISIEKSQEKSQAQSEKRLPTYLLVWTTTPWTLPGNSALAVNKNIKYVKVKIGDEHFILAESRLLVLKQEYVLIGEVKTEDLVDKSYKPLFDYYTDFSKATFSSGSKGHDMKLEKWKNGWKIYSADFVTIEAGTGIVHIAPAFGSDDYEFSQKYNIPFIQHVSTNGVFRSEVTDFAGQHVKPKDTPEDKAQKIESHQKGDIEIIKYLARKNLLFAKEKIVHSYPHCWRCETPLLNYSASSWFVRVTDLRDRLMKENKKVKWIPKEVGEGRFGNWLLGARDWAISRSRFWGAPLPVWKNEKTGERIVIDSVSTLKKYSKAKNVYYVMRHGEADNNTKSVISSISANPHHLTENGKKQVLESLSWIKNRDIDLIFSSPFIRTRETADIIAKGINYPSTQIIYDERLNELNAGVWNGKPFNDFLRFFDHADRFYKRPEGGENYADIKQRVGDFIYDLENKFSGKNILIITHDSPAFLFMAVSEGLTKKQAIDFRGRKDHYIENAKPFALNFIPLPHNEEYELDLHRPFIDDVELTSNKNGERARLIRVSEVFDGWFESGSMPFGSSHYPFNKEDFNPKQGPFSRILGKTKGYPADFISEGLDQTRGWFYSMIVLGIALFGKSPYKNVVVHGLVLAEDGQKMSKRKKNYPELMLIVNKYGADALRYFLMSSPVIHAEDVLFSEKSIDEIVKKHIGRLNNVVSFYEMYANHGIDKDGQGNKKNTKKGIEVKSSVEIEDNTQNAESKHPLDIWILNRLYQLGNEVTERLEKYEIDKAIRPFADFIDDLSTWYIRRSRDRFKGLTMNIHIDELSDLSQAFVTTKTTLIELSKLIAPFMPFLAEDVYRRVLGKLESVHLEEWPEYDKPDQKVLSSMKEIRRVASLGLEARMKAKINVRQPLSMLKVKTDLPHDEILVSILRDELNVQNVETDAGLAEEVWLDTDITVELKEEGQLRELIRSVQEMRKEVGLTIHDIAVLEIGEDHEYASLFKKDDRDNVIKHVMKSTLLSDIKFIPGNVSPHIHNSGVRYS